MLQKPRLPCTTFMAWWPGGRTRAKARLVSFSITSRAAWMAPPAETRCDSVQMASTEGKQKWARRMSVSVANSGRCSLMPSMSNSPSSRNWSWV